MSYIKNIEPEVNLKLADQIAMLPGQIVSKTLAQNGISAGLIRSRN